MTKNAELIARLNDVLSWELAGIIQNLNHSMMVTGIQRLEYAEFFSENSKENRDHAALVGNRIASLGGVPTVEPATIIQAVSLDNMLEAALSLEKNAMAAWEAALAASGSAPAGYKFWIEEMIGEEQLHIDELLLLTGKVSFQAEQIGKQGVA